MFHIQVIFKYNDVSHNQAFTFIFLYTYDGVGWKTLCTFLCLLLECKLCFSFASNKYLYLFIHISLVVIYMWFFMNLFNFLIANKWLRIFVNVYKVFQGQNMTWTHVYVCVWNIFLKCLHFNCWFWCYLVIFDYKTNIRLSFN